MTVLREVFDLPGDTDMNAYYAHNRAYYESHIPDGTHIACFAYIGDEIVGCGGICLYEEMPSPDNECGRCAYLMNIYTIPSCRGHGIGGKIVTYLIEAAKEKGASKIYLETSDDGRRLYEELGFTDMVDYMHL
ncbi:MAG: GNAT family N-acetyltransferase [Eggerthellaceae bacterium]|nr:GNAT family N-acetyltransferase [Eggerthellaceae bacterium]